jgi:hypothetical protein
MLLLLLILLLNLLLSIRLLIRPNGLLCKGKGNFLLNEAEEEFNGVVILNLSIKKFLSFFLLLFFIKLSFSFSLSLL